MSSRKFVAQAATAFLNACLIAGPAIADDYIDPNDCLKAYYEPGKAELIITAAPGKVAKIREALGAAGLRCMAQLQIDGACLVQVGHDQGKTIEAIAERVRGDKETQGTVGKVIINRDFAGPEKLAPATPVKMKDPLFRGQLELQALDAESAWFDAPQSEILTAIIDTGVRQDHEDFSGQFKWGMSIGCQVQPCNGSPVDTDAGSLHGTRVAGILAANKRNDYGGIGVAWNTKFMSIYYGPVVDQYRMSCALQYAIEKGASIVNASWTGGSDPGDYQRYPWDEFEKYVRLAADREVLVVFAAGKDDIDLDNETRYPLNLKLPNMLAAMEYNVASDTIPRASHGHDSVQIAAPNYATVTTCNASLDCYTRTEEPGSSWSAAYVSGAAALLKSHYPSMGYEFLRWRIIANATPDARLDAKNESGGRLNLVGTIFPVAARHGLLRRTMDTSVSWKTGIRPDMCKKVTLDGRSFNGAHLGDYFEIIPETPNDGVEDIPHGAIAGVEQEQLQLRVRCLDGNHAIAESLPVPLK